MGPGRRVGLVRTAVVLAAFAACTSSAQTSEHDAGVEADAEDGGTRELEVAPPALPEDPDLPTLAPCPEGWAEVPDEERPEIVVCEPWPGGDPRTCGDGEVMLPGRSACEPVGGPCPAGPYAEDLPDQGVVYVRAGVADGGDGTRARPLGSITEAIRIAPEGGVVALSRGVFRESVTVSRAVTLVGACATATWLAPEPWEAETPLALIGDALGARGLGVSGGRVGIDVRGDASPRLEAILVRGAADLGVRVAGGARLDAWELVVRDVGPSRTAAGILVEADGVADLTNTEVARVAGNGIECAGGRVTGRGVAVRELEAVPVQGWGLRAEALRVVGGGRAVLTEVVFDRTRRFAVHVLGEGTVVDIDLALVRAKSLLPGDGWGIPVVVEGAARAGLRRIWVDGGDGGFAVMYEGSFARIEDAVVRWTQSGGLLTGPYYVERGRAELSRVAALEVEGSAIVGFTAELAASDVFVRAASTAVMALDGSLMELDRVRAEGCSRSGVESIVASSLRVRDLTVVDCVAPPAGATSFGFCMGAQIAMASQATFDRVLMDSIAGFGLHLNSQAELDARDVTIRGTRANEAGHWGYGVIFNGASGTLVRSRIVGSGGLGIFAVFPAAAPRFEDVEVTGTTAVSCPMELPCEVPGTGVSAALGARADVRRFRIADNALLGVQVTPGSALDLHDGIVSGHPVGANVSSTTFDLDRLQDHVRWVDNLRALDAAHLPVPSLPDL